MSIEQRSPVTDLTIVDPAALVLARTVTDFSIVNNRDRTGRTAATTVKCNGLSALVLLLSGRSKSVTLNN